MGCPSPSILSLEGLQKPSPEFVWLPFPCQASSWAPVGCLRCHLLLTSTWLCSWKVLWLSIASTQRQSLLTTCPLTSKVQRQLLLLSFSCFFFFFLEFTLSVVPWDWKGVVATIHPLPASFPHAHESNTMNDISRGLYPVSPPQEAFLLKSFF